MPNWTPEQLRLHQMKTATQPEFNEPVIKSMEKEGEREAEIHDFIIGYCRRQDIPFTHGRMDKKTGRTPGEFDFYLFMPYGVILLLEIKTETGDLSPDQIKLHAAVQKNGHEVNLLRSIPEFMELMRRKV